MNEFLRVLIVDSIPSDAQLMVRALQNHGYAPEWERVTSRDGYLASLDPSLNVILADHDPPRFDSIETLRVLNETGLDVPLILVSRTLTGEIAARAILEGASQFVPKEGLGRLGPAVQRAIEDRRLRAGKRQAVQALKESQRFLKGLVETSPDILYTYDLDERRLLFVSNAVQRCLGYTPEALVEFGSSAMDRLLPSCERAVWEAHLDRMANAQDGEVFEIEHGWTHANGSPRWVRDRTVVLLRAPGGRVRQILGHTQDETANRIALDALLGAEAKYKTLVENLGEGVGIIDGGANFSFANPAAETIFGVPSGALVGRNLSEFMDLARTERMRQGKGLFPVGATGRYTTRITRPDGEGRTLHLTAMPQPGHQSRGGGVFAVFMDISDTIRHEEELRKAKTLEAIGMIAGGVAHEVRNPLFALDTLVAALKKKLDGREGVGEYLSHIHNQVRRLAHLMDDLLNLGRPIDSRNFSVLELRLLMEETVRSLAQAEPGVRARIRLELGRAPLRVRGIPAKLLQVFGNLIQNALALSPPGEKVQVRIREEKEVIAITIADRGPGIPEDIRARLFEPFQSRRKGGTGLGLAIVHRIVTAHGGTVTGGNNTRNTGAKFTVRLPAVHGL